MQLIAGRIVIPFSVTHAIETEDEKSNVLVNLAWQNGLELFLHQSQETETLHRPALSYTDFPHCPALSYAMRMDFLRHPALS